MAAVYFIATYDITDPDRYERSYVPGATQTLEAAGGQVVVASGSRVQLEGAAPGHTVLVRFPSEQAFRDWYHTDLYAPLRQVRLDTTTNGFAVLPKEFPRTGPRS